MFVDVLAYNSKVYYIITQGAGLGDDVVRGADHRQRNGDRRGGQPAAASRRCRRPRCGSPAPRPTASAASRFCPINWNDIAQGASTATNYQLMPGDRLFIAQDRLTLFNNVDRSRCCNPFERIFGFVSLGTSMANRIVRFGLANTF